MKITSSIPQKEKFFERFEHNARRHLPSTLRGCAAGTEGMQKKSGTVFAEGKNCACVIFFASPLRKIFPQWLPPRVARAMFLLLRQNLT